MNDGTIKRESRGYVIYVDAGYAESYDDEHVGCVTTCSRDDTGT